MTGALEPAAAAQIHSSFARQALMTTFGASLTRVEPGLIEVVAPILPLAHQQHGFAHAGLTFSLGDTAAGYAALTLMAGGEGDIMTAEMKINLLRPATGDRLVAVGEVVRAGRRLTVVTASVWIEAGEDRRKVAILQGTMVPA